MDTMEKTTNKNIVELMWEIYDTRITELAKENEKLKKLVDILLEREILKKCKD